MNLTFGDILVYILCYFGLCTSFYSLIILLQNRKDLKDKGVQKFPFVSVIVPAYNEEKTLKKTVMSLVNLHYPKEKYEVIIMNDGSKDNTKDIADELAKKYSFVHAYHIKNGGKGAALNFALKKAKGEFVGALDADSFVEPDAMKNIITRFEDPNTVAVTPSMKVYNPKNLLEIIQEVEYIFGIYLRKVFSFVGSIHVTPGPFSLFRKSFFDKHGGYDEHNLTEDIEIALRIQSKGYHIENSLDSIVYTVAPKKFIPLLKQRLRWYYGFFDNITKYPQLIHPKFGNLGLIYLPAAFLSIFLSIISMFYVLFKFGEALVNHIESFIILGWNYIHLFSFNFDLFFVNLDSVTVLSLVTLVISVSIIFVANIMSKGGKNIAYRFFLFSLFYWFFYAFWWLMALLLYLGGKKLKWGGRSI